MKRHFLGTVLLLCMLLQAAAGDAQIFSDAKSVAESFANAMLSADYRQIITLTTSRLSLKEEEVKSLDFSPWAYFKGFLREEKMKNGEDGATLMIGRFDVPLMGMKLLCLIVLETKDGKRVFMTGNKEYLFDYPEIENQPSIYRELALAIASSDVDKALPFAEQAYKLDSDDMYIFFTRTALICQSKKDNIKKTCAESINSYTRKYDISEGKHRIPCNFTWSTSNCVTAVFQHLALAEILNTTGNTRMALTLLDRAESCLQRLEQQKADPDKLTSLRNGIQGLKDNGLNKSEFMEKQIREAEKLIEDKNYSEADRVLSSMRESELMGLVSNVSFTNFVFYKGLLDEQMGRVDALLQGNVFRLEGVVTDKAGPGGTGGYWSFTLKADGGAEYHFECSSGDEQHIKVKDIYINRYEGRERLGNPQDRVTVYFEDGDYVLRNCKNSVCKGVCPFAIVIQPADEVQAATQMPRPTPAPSQATQTLTFDKPIATANTKAKATFYQDSQLQGTTREIETPASIEITGFVTDGSHYIVAVQISGGDREKSACVRIEDIAEMTPLDENGLYLQGLLASPVFNPAAGKETAKETMKKIDAYINNHPKGQLGPNAVLDYMLCLDWLLRNDPPANKDAVIRLAEIYLAKAKDRYAEQPQTQQCEAVVQKMKAPATP